MGELILCNSEIANYPYTIEGAGINLYSIEELCYYISNNIYFIEKEFMSEELCTWISGSTKNEKLGMELRNMMREDAPLSVFIGRLLSDVGYCNNQEIAFAVSCLKELEDKSDFECDKIRADRLMERKKYIACIFEYRRLLEQAEIMEEINWVLVGNLWHNLGTAYAKLFLFQEAAASFEKAYARNHNRSSLKQCLFAYRCLRDEIGFERICNTYHMSELEILEIRNELTIASRSEETVAFEKHLEDIATKGQFSPKAAAHDLSQIVDEWKEDYRRICRL